MKRSHLAVVVCLVAFAVRVGAFVALGRIHHPDVWEGEEIATNLLAGRGFVYEFLGTPYRSYMEPLYPALCALVYALTGHSYLALGIVQAALGAMLVWLLFAAGRRMGSETAGLAAAALAAVHPGLVAYTTKFDVFVLNAVFFVAVVIACLAYTPARPWRSAAAIGVAVGLCALSRGTIFVCLPVIGWWVWTHAHGRARGRVLQLALLLGCAAAVVAPWVIRNQVVHGRFMLTRSGTSLVFWLGNNPHAFSGSATTATGAPILAAIPPSLREQLRAADELGQQDLLRREAVAFVRAQPLAFVGRWLTKLGYFWWQSPQAGRLYPTPLFRLYQAFYLGMMALVLLAVAVHRRHPETWLIAGICLSIALVQSAYYVEGRHRLTIEPLLLLLAGQGLAWLLARRR
jgi:4-amino-4-deoxy-L-arabinose transferase-like glycosyltransferase